MLITNPQHTPRGDKQLHHPRTGRISQPKKLLLTGNDGEKYEHILPQTIVESSICPIDQDLSAADFSLKRQIELGSKLPRLVSDISSKFDKVDATISTLHLLNDPRFQKPSEPAAPSETAAPSEPAAPSET